MEVSIQASSSITRQDTFGCEDFAKRVLENVGQIGPLVQPDYKQYIKPALLRRTPQINRMALACVGDCESQSAQSIEYDGIVVGTGLGCLTGTEKFINQVITTSKDALLPPTAFIQSGHNAIAGQIALDRQNRGYNMTHVRGALSFEYALMDALLLFREGKHTVLVGAVDERIDLLADIATKLGAGENRALEISSGASFFILNNHPNNDAIKILKADVIPVNKEQEIQDLLASYYSDVLFLSQDIDHGDSSLSTPTYNFTDVCGQYWSKSGFGFHLAADFLKFNENYKRALIVNMEDPHLIGITLIGCE